MELIDKRAAEYRQAPFFALLRDTSIEPRRRLSFAPNVAHYVMSISDIYQLVLRQEPPQDEYQRLVNAETSEDEVHWQWFMRDLEKLDANPSVPFNDVLRFVWSDATVQMRMLTYQLCRLGMGADSLRKLVLLHVIEAAGRVTIESIASVGREFEVATGERLVYLGPHHVDAEDAHTLEVPEVQRRLEAVEFGPEEAASLLALVDETFGYFGAFIEEMNACAKSGHTIRRPAPTAAATSAAHT